MQSFCIAVCDDEEADRIKIKDMAGRILREEGIPFEISSYDHPEALGKDLQDGAKYHLLLLDVMMPKKNGMELARQLRSGEVDSSIVFISSNREMALQGYEVSAVRYLAKPLDENRLREALLFCYEKVQANSELFLPVTGGARRVSPQDIFYIEIVGRKCRICQREEEWDTTVSMGQLEDMILDRGFIRCHQSFLINLRYVQEFRKSSMELIDGRLVPVSKNRMKAVREAFFEYLKK